jgi:hypothetical protein
MIGPEFVEQANKELDGVLSRPESERFHRRLATDAEAAKYFESLRATLAAVDAAEEPDPPAQLESRILDAVPWGQHRPHSPARGRATFRDWWIFTPKLRYAVTFVFGVLFGLIVYTSIAYNTDQSPGGLDDADFYGTMRYIDNTDGFQETHSVGVNLDQVTGHVRLHEADRVLLAEVSLESAGEIEWVLQYDESDVSFEGFRQSEGRAGDVHATSTETRIYQTGEARYMLFFSQKHHKVTPITIKIFSADQLLLEQPLTPSAAREQ